MQWIQTITIYTYNIYIMQSYIKCHYISKQTEIFNHIVTMVLLYFTFEGNRFWFEI